MFEVWDLLLSVGSGPLSGGGCMEQDPDRSSHPDSEGFPEGPGGGVIRDEAIRVDLSGKRQYFGFP
jgi:hypothetical protein